MLRDHVQSGRNVTVGCIEVPRRDAHAFGVMAIDDARHITQFVEKPADPPAMPGNPDVSLASMGIYIFNAPYLYQLLEEDARNADSSHDFGKDLIPARWPKARPRPTLQPVGDHHAALLRPLLARTWAPSTPTGRLTSTSPPPRPQHVRQGLADLDLPGSSSPRRPSLSMTRTAAAAWRSTRWCRAAALCRPPDPHSVLFSSILVGPTARISEAVVLPDVQINRHRRLRKVVIDRAARCPRAW